MHIAHTALNATRAVTLTLTPIRTRRKHEHGDQSHSSSPLLLPLSFARRWVIFGTQKHTLFVGRSRQSRGGRGAFLLNSLSLCPSLSLSLFYLSLSLSCSLTDVLLLTICVHVSHTHTPYQHASHLLQKQAEEARWAAVPHALRPTPTQSTHTT